MPDIDTMLDSLFPAAKPFGAAMIRPANGEDLVALSTMKVGSTTPNLKSLRAVHHQAARLIATGMTQEEVSLHTGLCSSRLSILKQDPTFSGLVQFYTQAEGERFASVRDRMVQLGLTTAEALMERVIENPEEISTKDLTDILRSTLDRGGHAPVTKSESKHLHFSLSADELAVMKGEIPNAGTIRPKHLATANQAPALEVLPESQLGIAGSGGADSNWPVGGEVPAGKGCESSGTDV
jgi:hypothetical protein